MEVYFKDTDNLVKELMDNRFTSEENRIETSANIIYLITDNNILICDIAINKEDGSAYLRGNGEKMADEQTQKLSNILVKYIIPENHRTNN